MEWQRKKKLMFRWSLVSAGAIALFWGIWYLATGSVPEVKSIKMTPDWIITLPFGISRWWDVLMGPIWAIIITQSLDKIKDEDALAFGLIFGLIFGLVCGLASGLVCGLAFGLASGLAFGLVCSLAFGLVCSLAFGLVCSLAFGLTFGLACGLAFGLVCSLAFGLASGLVCGLASGLVCGLVFGLGYIGKKIFSSNFWLAITKWLLAEDI
jgi:hypothetical protein